MLTIIKSISLIGLNGYKIDVQVDVSNNMPKWEIIGLPDNSIRESKERVKAAIKNSGYELRSKKILINLAPAEIKKEGSAFDLAIAIGILNNIGYIQNEKIEEYAILGELSLNGKINEISGILPMCIELKRLGINKVILPKGNIKEASILKDLEIYGIENLKEAVEFLNGELKIEKNVVIEEKNQDTNTIDFNEVKGQENVKRALEIAAAGGHNCLMIGSPGSGKTMLAQRISTILPDMNFEESLEVTKIHSIAGMTKNNQIITKRPFRSPHHTASKISLVGGGKESKPGEISLAHRGILFLDELPEFNKNTLEVLRVPLEDRKVLISRANKNHEYPANFMLIASMNPCPCGYYGSNEKECTCSSNEINKYLRKISGPLLDRIDLQVEVSSIDYTKIANKSKEESSKEIKFRVNKARKIQEKRYKEYNIYSNSELTPNLIEKYCHLDEASKSMLEKAFEKLNLSSRAYSRILKVARTIADLNGKENITINEIAEAIQYRSLDKKYF
ncbi:MAG: YifB family Mg chelatase-like AAA ATPase [Clostridia bacterium]|nr:YifB family Mg chelatase-like AAA ATPase [Clostridia bacterium]